MKNLLKKLSRADRNDRRESLEYEAAERIKEVGGQAPPEAYSSEWASGASPVPQSATPVPSPHAAPVASPGRRLTVQERVAARELQSR